MKACNCTGITCGCPATQGVYFTGKGITASPAYEAQLAALRRETFTRPEVLTVLRALKANVGVVAGEEALDRAIRVFEGME